MVTSQPISTQKTLAAIEQGAGAVVTFEGVVRADVRDGRHVRAMLYECYARLAETEIERIRARVKVATGVDEIIVQHRTGEVAVGDTALLVVVRAQHRGGAFTAVQRVIDDIKNSVPIWKKELYDDGSDAWL